MSNSHISSLVISVLAATLFTVSILNCVEAKYNLPAGVLEQIGLEGSLKETFKCESDGYFADVDNECKIYHQCNSFGKKSTKFQQSTMACGPKQQFDQSKLACVYESDAIPCDASPEFQYLNDRIGSDGPFLDQSDIDKARNARPNYRAKK